jgi:hypothetical protein
MRSKTLALFIATMSCLALTAGPAHAADAETGCDGLDAALAQAETGDTVTIVEDNEDCVGNWLLPEGQTITLRGDDVGAQQVLRAGQAGGPILRGENVGETTIENLTFLDGNAAGSFLSLIDGGAIYLAGNSPATIQDNDFRSNRANRWGGAIAIDYNGSLPEQPPLNGEARGGSVVVDVTVRNNTFGALNEAGDEAEDGNIAPARGGSVYIFSSDPVDVSGNDFFGGDATDGSGGGVYVATGGHLTLADNVFFDNYSTQRGAGASARLCPPGNEEVASVTNNVFEDNLIHEPVFDRGARVIGEPTLGAGLHLVEQCMFQAQAARGNGEVFDVNQSGNDFIGNVIGPRNDFRLPGGGGGEAIIGLSTHSTNDYFFDNLVERTSAEGGGLYFEGFSGEFFEGRNLVAAANSIVEEPFEEPAARQGSPSGRGGGIYFGQVDFPGQLRLYDSTIVANSAVDGSGIDGGTCDSLILHNGIVYGNPFNDGSEISGFDGGSQCQNVERGTDPSGTRDVRFTDTCDSGDSGVTPHEGDGNICTDPLLVDPAGGDIKQTSGSPTRNKGSNALVPGDLSADFFGSARIAEGTVDMGAHEFPAPVPTTTPTPTPTVEGCLNSQGGVSGRRLGPVQLGRRRAEQRSLMRGAMLLTRLGLDKYCVTGGGLFRIGYPTARINRTLGRSLRRSVADRVVLAVTSSPRFNVSGIVPSQTSESSARSRLRGERRFRIGKNTWYVTGAPRPVRNAQGGVMRLVKAQRGRVREVGIGDSRLARGDRKQLKRYLKTWQTLGF